jgi:bacillithiol biosynthesis cysteine-adding enzyme BshC
MRTLRLPYADTRRFSPVVVDYLAGNGGVDELVVHRPDLAGIQEAARQRAFPEGHRAALTDALQRQYHGIKVHQAVADNLLALTDPRSLTVTTGHQLCLFTGPLYLPFKILNVVRLARRLTTVLDRPVVPIFWMATEDHDRDEIDHVWLEGRKVHWPGAAGGPVGRLTTEGLDALVQQACDLLGGAAAAEVRQLLRDCYRPGLTLARSTCLLVNALFGRFGVVCLDGDHPALKQLFAPVMVEELLNQVTHRTVTYANEKIRDRYAEQAHVREINLFHLRAGARSRIVQEDGHFRVLDGGPVFSIDELMEEVRQRPESFSPNVLLRPVYQETILPNIAYVGGGGELAYWLQLRWLFQALGVPMPVVLLRTSAAFITEKHLGQWQAAGLRVEDLFAPLDEVKAMAAARHATFPTDVDRERAALDAVYKGLEQRAAQADPTLRAAVEGRKVKAMKGLDALAKALVRAAKREQDVLMRRIDGVHATLFPGGALQERRDNIMPLLAARGMGLLDTLLDQLDPLDPRFTLLVEA